MTDLTPNQQVYKVEAPFDLFAFNALAVMGAIAGFHAGNKRIFIYQKDWTDFVAGSDPVAALIESGWMFFPLDIEKPGL